MANITAQPSLVSYTKLKKAYSVTLQTGRSRFMVYTHQLFDYQVQFVFMKYQFLIFQQMAIFHYM